MGFVRRSSLLLVGLVLCATLAGAAGAKGTFPYAHDSDSDAVPGAMNLTGILIAK